MTKSYIIQTLTNKGYKIIYCTDKTIIANRADKNYYAKSLAKLFKLVKDSNYGTK